MENRSLYTISFKILSLGSHVFEWTIDGRFFAVYEMTEISDAGIEVQLTLIKHTRFLELHFVMDGWVEVSCDRCLDPLRLDMSSDARMFVRFGNHADEDVSGDDDVIVLPQDEDRLDVAQYLYEYAHLSLPLRRVHTDNANGQSACNAEMMSRLNDFLVNSK